MIWKAVSSIAGGEIDRGTLNDFLPIKILFAAEYEFTGLMASIKRTRHDGGKKEIIIAVSVTGLVNK